MTKKCVALAMSCAFLAAVIGGCATSGGAKAPVSGGPGAKATGDKDQILASINAWKAGLAAKNVDQILAVYSENFKDSQGRGKAEVRKFIETAVSRGNLDGIVMDTGQTVVTVNGTTATASPILLNGSFGTFSMTTSWAKEAAGWKIVSVTRI